jgi:hypothetical protein
MDDIFMHSNNTRYGFTLVGNGAQLAYGGVPAGLSDPVAGDIYTVAGNGTPGYSGDGGPATSAELNGPAGVALDTLGNLFIADYFNSRIRQVNTAGIITTVAGNGTPGYNGDGIPATSAELFDPTGVALDAPDNLYIADYGNNRVRQVLLPTPPITVSPARGLGVQDFIMRKARAVSPGLSWLLQD